MPSKHMYSTQNSEFLNHSHTHTQKLGINQSEILSMSKLRSTEYTKG
jgi:hypothetical protein